VKVLGARRNVYFLLVCASLACTLVAGNGRGAVAVPHHSFSAQSGGASLAFKSKQLRPAAPADFSTILVTVRPGVDLASLSLPAAAGIEVVRTLPAIHTLVARVQAGDAADAVGRLALDPRFLAVTPDATVTSDLVPNDPYVSRQWALQMIQAPFAWEIARGGAGVVVGVLDSGVDLTHPDLAAHVLPIGCDLIADKGCKADGHGTPPLDTEGHGTHVAGIVAGVTDDHTGIAGVAWNASILPVRVTRDNKGTESDFITGLLWALDHGARVLNFSFSEDCGTPESPALRDALAYAWDHGAVLVASAGNGSGCPQGLFPAADPHVLAVASTNMDDKPSAFSNFGPWVRISAPGERILSTWSHGEYAIGSGTSMAAPHVAGLAALLLAAPGASNKDVVNWILATADVPDGWNPAYGVGRMNAYRAVSLANRSIDPHSGSRLPATLHLKAGWNNVLYVGPTRSVATGLKSIEGKYSSVYSWDPIRGTWSVFLRSQPVATDLQLVQERSAYWIFMQADADLTMTPTGTDPPPQMTLAPGWNNLGLPAGTLPAILQSFSAPVSGLFAWDAGAIAWKGFFAGAAVPSDLNAVDPGAAYWVYIRAALVVRFTP
jgi:thermitase